MAEGGRRGTEVLEVEVAVDWSREDVLKARWVFVLESASVWEVGVKAPAKDVRNKRQSAAAAPTAVD